MKTTVYTSLTALLLASAVLPLQAQRPLGEQPEMPLTPAVRKEVIDGTISRLNASYVFPETAKKMEAAIRKHEAAHDYDTITSARAFATRLTDDLRAVSHDRHLHIVYSNTNFQRKASSEPSPAELEGLKKFAKSVNYGFEKLEILDGNVGYLSLRGFMPPEIAGETAAAAMNYLANTDALIIDLRRNGGGEPEMVQFLCSYLFEQQTHLNDLYFRPDDSTHQYWTLPYVPGKRYVNKPVYVLTSKDTFSAAEEFTYNLKNLKRATIIGETTGGGAHPGGEDAINAHFAVWVPTGRAINPVSKSNWEGTGIAPDISVEAKQALPMAHRTAIRKLVETESDPEVKARRSQLLESLEKEASPKKS